MKTFSTTYLGLKLNNPIVASSSGLTGSIEKIKDLERAGVGAVVLKSLFEEQIMQNSEELLQAKGDYTEAADYIKNFVQAKNVTDYLQLVTGAKRKTALPVIASINCRKAGEWENFARQIELAGADAIELNLFMLNTDKDGDSNAAEQEQVEIVRRVVGTVNIPVAVKIGRQYTNLVSFSERLAAAGARGITLFNRYYQPDIDLETLKVKQGEVFSSPAEFADTLRWTALVSGRVKHVDIASSAGVYGWEYALKAILAGAQAVQMCSAIYQKGSRIIPETLTGMEHWLKKQGYYSLNEIRGKLSYSNIADRSIYERVQFMRYYSARE
ncbi:MAG: dihydroorotate dehydrogenase-like protein [Prevotellaceae bacterium]|jgi:dihydroorotate dehydrogenase (fumarate)|nr:dihydroorotate dehydrogenase-like protein [Prevotellaceae bacterium]